VEPTNKQGQKVRFIRKNGRVIPIPADKYKGDQKSYKGRGSLSKGKVQKAKEIAGRSNLANSARGAALGAALTTAFHGKFSAASIATGAIGGAFGGLIGGIGAKAIAQRKLDKHYGTKGVSAKRIAKKNGIIPKKAKKSKTMGYLKKEYGMSESQIKKVASSRGIKEINDKMSGDSLGELEWQLEKARSHKKTKGTGF
jgi:hypothetical protein